MRVRSGQVGTGLGGTALGGMALVGTALAVVGVLGALLWVGRWALGDAPESEALLWAGAGLLSVLAVAAGASLVKPPPLRAVVGLCVGLLCWSLGAVAGLAGAPVRAGIVGLVLVVVIPVAWERFRPLPAPVASRRTSDSASTAAVAEPAVASGPRRRADRRSRSPR